MMSSITSSICRKKGQWKRQIWAKTVQSNPKRDPWFFSYPQRSCSSVRFLRSYHSLPPNYEHHWRSLTPTGNKDDICNQCLGGLGARHRALGFGWVQALPPHNSLISVGTVSISILQLRRRRSALPNGRRPQARTWTQGLKPYAQLPLVDRKDGLRDLILNGSCNFFVFLKGLYPIAFVDPPWSKKTQLVTQTFALLGTCVGGHCGPQATGEPCTDLTVPCKLRVSLYSCQCARGSPRSIPGRGYHYSCGADSPSRSILFLKYQNISYDNKQQWLHVHCSSRKDTSVRTFLCKHLTCVSWVVCTHARI